MLDPNKAFYEDETLDPDLETNGSESAMDGDEQFDEFDDEIVDDIDFSEIRGKSFKSSLGKFNKTYNLRRRNKKLRQRKQQRILKPKKSLLRRKPTKSIADGRFVVPNDTEVILEGVDKIIFSKDRDCSSIRNIGYYKCKKLKEMVLFMSNNSPIDFNLELFNPSMPLDYLFATSGNLNNKVQVAGGSVAYSDILFNILANPTHIVNAKFTFAGVNVAQQINQPLIFKQKNVAGEQVVEPLQLQLTVDVMQVATDIVFFDFQTQLNRPYVPNGMDVIQYKVLAGNTVTFSFFYRQKDLRKFFIEESRKSKKILS